MGSVIGKQGSKIKEIQEASGARLQASEAMLPGSTEVHLHSLYGEEQLADTSLSQRVLTIAGVADAIHIAVYYVGTILIENLDRQPANTPYRPAGSLGPPPPSSGPRSAPYPSSSYGSYPPAPPPHPAYAGSPTTSAAAALPSAGAGGPTYGGSTANQPGSQTQQIFIPNELVGSIIGKAGSKINEVRNLSACHIKILDQGAEGSPPGERVRYRYLDLVGCKLTECGYSLLSSMGNRRISSWRFSCSTLVSRRRCVWRGGLSRLEL